MAGSSGVSLPFVLEPGYQRSDVEAATAETTTSLKKAVRRWKIATLLATMVSFVFLGLFLMFALKHAEGSGNRRNDPVYGAAPKQQIREAFKRFVDSIDPRLRRRVYHQDVSLQEDQWEICTIVQQCGMGTRRPNEPYYMLSLGNITQANPQSTSLFREALAAALPLADYNMMQMQEIGNLLLYEYQHWAVSCPGKCVSAPSETFWTDEIYNATIIPGTNFTECAGLYNLHRYPGSSAKPTTWICDDAPLLLFGDYDTDSGRYKVNNLFIENEIHARNNFYDYVSVYGDLSGDGPFGFRYSGHHFDINFIFREDGTITALPAFFGHNPMVVLNQTPPLPPNMKDYHTDPTFLLWRNFRGSNLFKWPGILEDIFEVSKILLGKAKVPLNDFLSTPAIGGLTLKDNKTILDVPNIKLNELSEDEFREIIDLVDYTHLGQEVGDHSATRYDCNYVKSFRETGRMIWTTAKTLPQQMKDLEGRPFFYVKLESDDMVYFIMLNQMFTLVSEAMPSNHLHSLLLQKRFLPKEFLDAKSSYTHRLM